MLSRRLLVAALYLIDVFEQCCSLRVGEQHDAREALEEILTRTRLGKELFDTGATGVQRSDIVSLPGFAQDGWWYQKFTSHRHVTSMRELLEDGFNHLHDKLLVPPPLLAVVLPPVELGASGTSIWLNGTRREQVLRADWGNCALDLAAHFSAQRNGDEEAVYKLAGYVSYEGDVDVIPNLAFTTGHFMAYFREKDDWYKADDSIVIPTGKRPTAFPYICIFERVDLDISLPWPPSIFSCDEDDADEYEGGEEEEDEEEGEEEEDGDDIEEEEDREDEKLDVEMEEEEEEARRQEAEARRRRQQLSETLRLNNEANWNASLAYESLCVPWTNGHPTRVGTHSPYKDLPITLCPKKILDADETTIKMTRVDTFDTTIRTIPSSEYPVNTIPRYCHGRALPEAFFQDDGHDLNHLFGNMRDTVDAMRRIISLLPRGVGLGHATRAYFFLQWKQTTPTAQLMKHGDSKPAYFVLDRRDTRRDAGRQDAFYCFETLFFRMCEAAMQLGRGKEIEEALPRPRLLLEAVALSSGCVEGLKQVAVRLDDHDYKTTHANLQALMKRVWSNKTRLNVPPQQVAMERLDAWREWSLTIDGEGACKKRRGFPSS